MVKVYTVSEAIAATKASLKLKEFAISTDTLINDIKTTVQADLQVATESGEYAIVAYISYADYNTKELLARFGFKLVDTLEAYFIKLGYFTTVDLIKGEDYTLQIQLEWDPDLYADEDFDPETDRFPESINL